jgi:hypothetical protein
MFKLLYVHVSANHVAIFRDVKYKGQIHVGFYCVYKLISMYLCACVGIIILCI